MENINNLIFGLIQTAITLVIAGLLKSKKNIENDIVALKTDVAVSKQKSLDFEKDVSDINKKLDKITDILMGQK